MATVHIYGIPNCDTIKKTLNWFNRQGITYVFHDYKKEGIKKGKLQEWCRKAGWETVMNKRSTTWRETDPAVQAGITNAAAAIGLMMEANSLIKRPVIETEKGIIIGFDEKNILSQIKQIT